MKINIQSIDTNSFYVNEHILNGELLYLATPKQIGCEWNKDNIIFRSSLWNSDGELVSASFKKFVNWGEKPEVFPVPQSLRNCSVVEKMDGSTLIISKYKNQTIIRTRGTVDASTMEQNGHEIEIFKNEILPKLIDFIDEDSDAWHCSFIFEWTSPLNKIVINYGDKPRFVLIGLITHDNYHLYDQEDLNDIAKHCGLERPATYTFTDITSLISDVELWEGKEGVCVYSKGGQEIHKCKSFSYLRLHRMKSELSSMEKVIDVWVAQGYPSYNDFYNYIMTTFDFELAEQCRGFISKIADGHKEVLKIIAHMKSFVEPLKMEQRSFAAARIIGAYGETNRKSFCFNLLDGKELDGEAIKKLMFQVLKN